MWIPRWLTKSSDAGRAYAEALTEAGGTSRVIVAGRGQILTKFVSQGDISFTNHKYHKLRCFCTQIYRTVALISLHITLTSQNIPTTTVSLPSLFS